MDDSCIELSDETGRVRAVVNPVGAALLELSVAGDAVLPKPAPNAQAAWFAGVTLAPWPNRMAHARWRFGGADLIGEVNNPPDNAHHGLVFGKQFRIVESAADRVRLAWLLGSDPVYPFPVRIEVGYSVSTSGVTVDLQAENLGNEVVPVALGGHPYLAVGPQDRLVIAARRALLADAAQLPTGQSAEVSALGLTAGEPALVAALTLDDCFTELTRDADGVAHTLLQRPDGSWVDVWQGSGFDFTMIYTHPRFPYAAGSGSAIAIEPQTAPANALNSGDSLIWLEPATSWRGRWGISRHAAGSRLARSRVGAADSPLLFGCCQPRLQQLPQQALR